jgi:hypothetical protein
VGLLLKVSTAADVLIGPFVDDADGNTEENALTREDSDILLSKNGGALTAKNDAGDAAFDAQGYYTCPLDASDTDTLGRLQLCVHMAGALPVYHEYTVVSDTESTAAEIADAVWDEPMVGHITENTAAYILRSLNSIISIVSLAQAGTADTITLVASSSAVNDYYKGQTVCVILGAGLGQARAIYEYDGATKVAKIRPSWATAPNGTSYYAILNVGSSVVAAIEPEVVDDVWDEPMEGAVTAREQMNINTAALAGKSSGGGTATVKFRDQADTKDRITATVTAEGDRTAVTADGS